MTETRVPEEILREILEYAIWPDPMSHWLDESEDVYDSNLGGPLDTRSPHVFLVNKRWLRVATPIFY